MTDWWKTHCKRAFKKYPEVVSALQVLAHAATEMPPKELVVFTAQMKAISDESISRVQAEIDRSEQDQAKRREELKEQIMKADREDEFSYEDVALVFDVSVRTVRKWVKEGKLEAGKSKQP